jgi:hypothetical protein
VTTTTCPGCGGKKTRRARVCRDCRRRAGDLGLGALLAGPLSATSSAAHVRATETLPPSPMRPISPGKRDAFHAKCYELAKRRGHAKADIRNETLAAIAQRFGRQVGSVTDLYSHEASWALDRLEELLESEPE